MPAVFTASASEPALQEDKWEDGRRNKYRLDITRPAAICNRDGEAFHFVRAWKQGSERGPGDKSRRSLLFVPFPQLQKIIPCNVPNWDGFESDVLPRARLITWASLVSTSVGGRCSSKGLSP